MEIAEHQTAVALVAESTNKVDSEYKVKFDPPAFLQRYDKVHSILIDERWRKQIKKLCDFGCADFGLFFFIKELSSLNDICFIDIEEDLLRDNVTRIYSCSEIEYLNRKEEPLVVNVFAGSVADPDHRLSNTDAVVAIELIEHLYPDTLDAFPYNIFGFIEPKIVIITTPNADFNVLFSSDPNRMRHYDHKFEWTREQFSDWAFNVISRFPDYTVSISGIGPGPDGTKNLGYCSQMALFIRKDILDDSHVFLTPCCCDRNCCCKGSSSFGICTYYSCSKQIIENKKQNSLNGIHYKLIKKVEYPFQRDGRTEEEKIMDEFRYRIHNLGRASRSYYMKEKERSEIPLVDLNYTPFIWPITESELSKLLTKNGYKIEYCEQWNGRFLNSVVHQPEITPPSSDYEVSSDEGDYSEASGDGNNSPVLPLTIYEPYSDWDDWK